MSNRIIVALYSQGETPHLTNPHSSFLNIWDDTGNCIGSALNSAANCFVPSNMAVSRSGRIYVLGWLRESGQLEYFCQKIRIYTQQGELIKEINLGILVNAFTCMLATRTDYGHGVVGYTTTQTPENPWASIGVGNPDEVMISKSNGLFCKYSAYGDLLWEGTHDVYSITYPLSSNGKLYSDLYEEYSVGADSSGQWTSVVRFVKYKPLGAWVTVTGYGAVWGPDWEPPKWYIRKWGNTNTPLYEYDYSARPTLMYIGSDSDDCIYLFDGAQHFVKLDATLHVVLEEDVALILERLYYVEIVQDIIYVVRRGTDFVCSVYQYDLQFQFQQGVNGGYWNSSYLITRISTEPAFYTIPRAVPKLNFEGGPQGDSIYKHTSFCYDGYNATWAGRNPLNAGVGAIGLVYGAALVVVDVVDMPSLRVRVAVSPPTTQGDSYTPLQGGVPLWYLLPAPQPVLEWAGQFSQQSRYRLYLTGEGAPLLLAMSSFQCFRDLTHTQLTVVCPNPSPMQIASIEARRTGDLLIQSGMVFATGQTQWTDMLRAAFAGLRADTGGRRASITLTGQSETSGPSSQNRKIKGVSYDNTTNGDRRIRCAVDTYLMPGDWADIGDGDGLLVDSLTYSVSPEQSSMEIVERGTD